MASLVAALAILAFLQYRSTQQLTSVLSEQMRATLNGVLFDMRGEVEDELTPLCRSLQASLGGPQQDEVSEYGSRFALWQRTSAKPQLAANFYLWPRRAGPAALLRLDPARKTFVQENWPVAMSRLRQRLEEMSGAPPSGWFIDEHVPALVHASVTRDANRSRLAPALSWVIVQLNLDVLVKDIFPELTNRYFYSSHGLIYRIAVLSGVAGQPPIYSSDPDFPSRQNSEPDAVLNLFGPPFAAGSTLIALQLPRTDSGRNDSFALQPLPYASGEGDWHIIAQHRQGSVERVVYTMLERDLALNFGVLVLLAITLGLIIITSARARRLAQVKVDFVANVSHELRTPLTGILAAAQNVADGVVEEKEQLTRYGQAIVRQARLLGDLIEQILTFSAVEEGRYRYHLQLTGVAPIVESSLENTAALAEVAGVQVEREVPAGLPPVEVDFKAMCQCLQNLIANAIKYSGDGRWVRVRAFTATANRGPEVAISVEDHGLGIEAADLERIFEPFYRSAPVLAAQIRGSGLGLPLARSIAEAMGGRVTAESTPGKGSTFTIYLPVA
jgi:signal transduction histidine kinase